MIEDLYRLVRWKEEGYKFEHSNILACDILTVYHEFFSVKDDSLALYL